MEEYREEDIDLFLNEQNSGLLYLYTPLCGTCQTASKILTVLEQVLPQIQFVKTNLNYAPNKTTQLEIESVPCLLVIQKGKIVDKIYAFHSVPYLYEKLIEWFEIKKMR